MGNGTCSPLGAIAHYDYRQPASYSYEQAIQVIRRMGLPRKDMDQQVLRAIFNVVGRNCDDHVKNIAFLMNRGVNGACHLRSTSPTRGTQVASGRVGTR